MKKIIICFFIITMSMLIFTSWNGLDIPRGTITQELASFQGKNNVLRFQPASGGYDWCVVSKNLDQYAGQNVEIKISMSIWVDAPVKVMWHVLTMGYPTVLDSEYELSAGRWHTIQGSKVINIQKGNLLYLTPYNLNNTSGYIADLNIEVNVINITYENNLPALHTKWPFKVGAAVFSEDFTENSPQSGLFKHFNVFTAGTLYPLLIMPDPWTPNGSYRWENTDILMRYAERNEKSVRGHVLFFHHNTPEAFFRGSGREGRATIDELYTRMENHAKTVFRKYGSRIEWWDVCNEVVGDDGDPKIGGNPPLYSPYAQIMNDAGKTGMDRYEYVLKAFQWARQYADANGGRNVKLYLTEYHIETRGPKLTGFLRLLDYLIENNAPIDGVGIQCHIRHDWPRVSDLSRAIDDITAKQINGRNLVVQICELDMSLYTENESYSNNPRRTLSERDLNTRLNLQTRRYRELFDMFEQKYNQGKLDLVVLWGIADGHSWLNNHPVHSRTNYPLLFDRNYQAKPAFHELIRGR